MPPADDPATLFAPIEAAWEEYVRRGVETLREVETQIAETRHAAEEDWWFLPDHPLWDRFRIGDRGDSWKPRPLRWVPAGEGTVPHGLDAGGRVRTAGFHAVVYGDGFHDLLLFGTDRASGERRPFHLSYNGEFPRGRVKRIFTDDAGRIVAAAQVNQGGEEPHLQYRTVQQFEYAAAGRFAGSTERWFTRGRGEGKTPETHPEVAPGYFEAPYMRQRIAVTYDDAGRVAQAEAFDEFRGGSEILYSYNPGDTVGGLVAELSALLGKQIPKAVLDYLKANPAAKPAAAVALIYSAEHAHCGLPTGIILAGEADAAGRFDPLDWEAYPHELAWPPGGRTGRKLNDLHRRLLLTVEDDPAHADTFQPRPYREVLWKAGRAAWEALKDKRATAAGFTLVPIDDHGDADAAEDVRETLPPEAAAAALAAPRSV